MKLIITIDTEEDNWASYSATDNPVSNIEKLIPLQQMFDRYQIKPTYLISYPVATNPRSVEILKSFLDSGKCEIGMHCHPWNTPPFEEEINDYNSMLCNLSEELVYKKLNNLHRVICDNFGIVPVSFRSGRWGFGPGVARSLVKLGYKVDTSVSPFVDWSEYYGPDYRNFPLQPYSFHPDDIELPCVNGLLLQVPATVGFLQSNFEKCKKTTNAIETRVGRLFRLKGLLDLVGVLNQVWLSPELATSDEMIRLARRLQSLNYCCLNMSFHSTTLMAGLSPFVTNAYDEQAFTSRIEDLIKFTQEAGLHSITLSELAE